MGPRALMVLVGFGVFGGGSGIKGPDGPRVHYEYYGCRGVPKLRIGLRGIHIIKGIKELRVLGYEVYSRQ